MELIENLMNSEKALMTYEERRKLDMGTLG
jgi:hypothetical protein